MIKYIGKLKMKWKASGKKKIKKTRERNYNLCMKKKLKMIEFKNMNGLTNKGNEIILNYLRENIHFQ